MSRTVNAGKIKGLEQLQKKLSESSGKVVIVTHFNPDGDAIGSALGLKMLLTKAGHACSILVPNDFPEYLKWLPGASEIVILSGHETMVARLIESCDFLFFVDFNDIRRMKGISDHVSLSSAFKTLIDHHPNPFIEADCMWSDTSVGSTAELIYRFGQSTGLNKYIDKAVAECLFVGIMTDTGCFSYNSSQPETYTIVADLLQYGIDKDQIYYRIYDNFSCDRMRLLGFCLHERMIHFPEYRTAMIWLNLTDQKNFRFQTGDSEGFVNYPLSIRGVRFSAFFIEKEDHIKVSFRSKGDFPVNTFSARYFNGGGHRNASGGESYDGLEITLEKFRGLLPEYKDELNDYEG